MSCGAAQWLDRSSPGSFSMLLLRCFIQPFFLRFQKQITCIFFLQLVSELKGIELQCLVNLSSKILVEGESNLYIGFR